MKKIIDEIKHLWTYHVFKVVVIIAVIAAVLIIT